MPAADDRRGLMPSPWLYVPGDRPDRFAKAITASPGVILDLEDAVAAKRKQEARINVRTYFDQNPTSTCTVAVRINALSSVDGLNDVIDLLSASTLPHAIVIPKAEDAAIIRMLDQLLSTAKAPTELFALIESPRGLTHAEEIAAATPRLTSLMFGAADYAAALGREAGQIDLTLAGSTIVNAAASAGALAIDAPFFVLNDSAGLEAACRTARRLGFHGKAAIHPGQVETIETIFAPTPDELERARQIVAQEDDGASAVDNRMIDVAMVRWAKRLVS